MTKQGAIDTGQRAAETFGKPFVVYRFPLWPADVYAVIAVDRELPPHAETCERLEPHASQPAAGQGALF